MKKLLLLFAVVLFVSCSSDDNNSSKKGVEILSYDVSTSLNNPSGYRYTFDVLIKNHSSEVKTGIINISLDMGNNTQGFNHINVTLEPNETKEISDSNFVSQSQNGTVKSIKFDELD